jgi:chitodextrinase
VARGFRIGHPKQYWINCASGVYANAGQIMTIVRDTEAPTVPGSISVVSVSASTISITWTASTDNNWVDLYEVQRRVGSGGAWSTVYTTGGLSFADSGLTVNTNYQYQVRARDAAGNYSAFSAIGSGVTTDNSGTVTKSMNVTPAAYWTPHYNFVDMFFDSDGTWQGGWETTWPGATNQGWPLAVPAGVSVNRIIKWMDQSRPDGEPVGTYIRAGNYKIVVTAGWSATLTNQIGITNLVPGGTTCTFTIASSMADFRIWIEIRNTTGSPKDMVPGDVKIYHVDDEAKLNAGQLFSDVALEPSLHGIKTPPTNGRITRMCLTRRISWAARGHRRSWRGCARQRTRAFT